MLVTSTVLISGGPTSTLGVYFNSDTGAILRGADALVAEFLSQASYWKPPA